MRFVTSATSINVSAPWSICAGLTAKSVALTAIPKGLRICRAGESGDAPTSMIGAKFSLKVGTIFEDSPIGLDKWFTAMWLLANCKNGVSSYEIARDIHVTQKTAWFMLHRLRLAMNAGSFDKMTGEVEADETFIGGLARFMHKSNAKGQNHGHRRGR